MDDNDELISSLFRNRQYMPSLYTVKEEIQYSKAITKYYAFSKQKNKAVVITKQSNFPLYEFAKRLVTIVKLLQENVLLIENLWLEEVNKNEFSIFISEHTKSTYRNEFNLITFSFYLNQTKGVDLTTNIKILINLLKKLQIIHKKKQIAHLNLSPNNIYFNSTTFDVYLGPCYLIDYDDWNFWYLPPEHCYIEKIIKEDLQSGIFSDIWSFGCILSEMFFVMCPLFQSFSQREKMKKIIEVLGVPSVSDVDYMTRQEFNILQSTEKNPELKRGSLFDIYNEEDKEKTIINGNRNHMIKKNIYDIMLKCLIYNRFNRVEISEILNALEDIDERYIKAKPLKKGVKTIINRDNLLKENQPLNLNDNNNIVTLYKAKNNDALNMTAPLGSYRKKTVDMYLRKKSSDGNFSYVNQMTGNNVSSFTNYQINAQRPYGTPNAKPYSTNFTECGVSGNNATITGNNTNFACDDFQNLNESKIFFFINYRT